jgi:hypothetical protein
MNTQECYIDDKKYTIDEFIENKKLILKCKKGKKTIYDKNKNEIIFCDGKKVKPYFRKLINNDNQMTEWHKKWQNEFNGYTEQKYECNKMHKKYRRADVDLNENQIIEFQHSRIEREEVLNRKNDYEKVNKEIIWVIDGNKNDDDNDDVDDDDYKENIIITKLENERIFMEFKMNIWKYASFIDYEVIYLDINNEIYKIQPLLVKSKMIDIQKPISKVDFCDKIKNGIKLFEDETIIQSTVYVKQQGAGNGKTFGATNLLSEEFNNNNTMYHHYDTFLYLTKQHSAKTVIFNEFIKEDKITKEKILKSEYLTNNFELVDMKENKKNKKYYIVLKNKKTNRTHKIIIATIDSFIFALGDKQKKGIDKFMTMVNSIIEEEIECNKSGYNDYAGGVTINKKMLIVGDEMQDLEENYVKAILKICTDKYVDFYMVGDIMQSIKTENNSFTYLSKTKLPNIIKVIKPNAENNVMRFGSEELINFVNDIIPFEKYGLPCIKKHENNKDDGTQSKLVIFEGNTIYATDKNKCKINIEVQNIMNYYREEVEINKCKPNDFLIVIPFTKKNPLIEALHLEIREFWKEYYKTNEYTQYSVFHKSEDGSTIDLNESKDATRIVSIHTSKGDGRDVVFVIGLNEDGLKKYSEETNNLVYDSLLHVALTRMKKRLYIRRENNNDDICKKLSKYNMETTLSPHIDFSKKIDYEKITSKQMQKNYEILYEKIIKKTNYCDFIKSDDTGEKEMIDIKHHSIRCSTMHILFLLSIANKVIINNKKDNEEFISQQVHPILNKCVYSKIAEYLTTTEYNKSMYDKDNREIPILKYENGDYEEVYNELISKINSNKNKIKKLLYNSEAIQLDIIESICLYHTIEVCENKYKSILPITDMYDIIDIYLKSTHKEKQKYLKSHYTKTDIINNIFEKIHKKYPKMKWLWEKYSEFKGCSTSIKIFNFNKCIAYDDINVIICKICPQFNELNYAQIIYDSIFDIFLTKNSKDDKGYFKNKKIVVCIVTLDMTEPYYIDLDNSTDENNKCIKYIIKNNIISSYAIKNKGLYLLYNFYKKEYNELTPYEIITKIVIELKKIDDEKPLPDYVSEFFNEIKTNIKKELKDKNKQKEIIEYYDNYENFMSEINFSMNEMLDNFFGFTDEDNNEFNNIKCNDTNENIKCNDTY